MVVTNAGATTMNTPIFEWGRNPTPLEPKDWPYYQKYMGTCMTCDNRYNGPKRSMVCWECLHEQSKSDWIARNT